MDIGNALEGLFEGIYKTIIILLILSGFGIWKIVEIIIWLLEKI